MRKQDFIITVSYIIFGILTRTIWHIGPNIEFITATSLGAGYFLKRSKAAWIIPFLTMLLSDCIIGNTNIILFTWSAYVLAPVFSKVITKEEGSIIQALSLESAGILFTFFFYLWTNLGVFVVSNLYPKTLAGLEQSYINGIPFLINQVIGNMIIVPVIFIATYTCINRRAYLESFLRFLTN